MVSYSGHRPICRLVPKMGGTCDVGLGSTKQAKSGGIKHSNRRFQIIVITLASAEAGEQQRVRGIHSPGIMNLSVHSPGIMWECRCSGTRLSPGALVADVEVATGL